MKAHTSTCTVVLGLAMACAGICGCSGGKAPAGQRGPSPMDAALNPDGFAYPNPAAGYGRSPRSGSTPGSVIKDLTFQGYPDAMISSTLSTIALADYYDPCSKRYRLIHLTVASVWCNPCNQETDAIAGAMQDLDTQGVVVLQVLNDGPMQGVDATAADLQGWIEKHHPYFAEMLDPGLQSLGGFFNATAVPWNCDIDPRTMEIIDSSTGWSGDVNTELATAVEAVLGAPGYPVSVACK